MLLGALCFSANLSAQVPVVTQTNVTARVMAANLSSGNFQRYAIRFKTSRRGGARRSVHGVSTRLETSPFFRRVFRRWPAFTATASCSTLPVAASIVIE